MSTSPRRPKLYYFCIAKGVVLLNDVFMTEVFCCGCWWLCCVRCCGFCVLPILFCRVLSLPLTLKTSQTCSLVYTVNIRKITTLLLQQIRHTFCQTLCTKRGQNRTTCARNHTKTWSRKYLKRWTTLGKKTGNMYSTDTQREPTLLLKMSKPVENETNYRAK